MITWFKSVILHSLLIIDSFSACEDIEFLNLATAHNVDVAIIPEGMHQQNSAVGCVTQQAL